MNRDVPSVVIDRLQRWIDENAAKVDRALLANWCGDRCFVAIQKSKKFDADLMDRLTELDLEIANDESCERLLITTILLPCMCDDSLRGIIDIHTAKRLTPTDNVPYNRPHFPIDREKWKEGVERSRKRWDRFYAENPLYCPYEIGGVDMKSEDVACDVCGASCRRDMNIESGVLYGSWGFDSARDMDESLTNLCESCFGKVEDFIRSLGGSPRVRNFVTWSPGDRT